MEQLALFALPRHLPTEDTASDVGSNNAAADPERDSISLSKTSTHRVGSLSTNDGRLNVIKEEPNRELNVLVIGFTVLSEGVGPIAE